MRRRHLAVWAGQSAESEPPRLTLGQVLYAPPNPDCSRKRCGNCLLWLGGMGPQGAEGGEGARGGREQCFIHDADVVVLQDMVCGYHVYGVSLGASVGAFRENIAPVTPEFSGLEQTRDGSCCEGCQNYTPTLGHPSGLCSATYEAQLDGSASEEHAVVQALGCCAAWVSVAPRGQAVGG